MHHRVRCAGVILVPALEKCPKVARDRQAQAKLQRVLGTVDQSEVPRLEPGIFRAKEVLYDEPLR
jgi:hypothetical protein